MQHPGQAVAPPPDLNAFTSPSENQALTGDSPAIIALMATLEHKDPEKTARQLEEVLEHYKDDPRHVELAEFAELILATKRSG